MPYKPKSRSGLYRGIILSAIFAILVLAVVNIVVRHQKSSTAPSTAASTNPTNTIDYSPATPADNTANENRKSTAPGSGTLSGGSASNSSSFSVQIVSANPTGNKNVHIGTLVNGTSTGTCTLTATQNGQANVVDTSHSVQQNVNEYDCGVYNLALPTTGEWKLTLTVSSNGSQASDSETVTATN